MVYKSQRIRLGLVLVSVFTLLLAPAAAGAVPPLETKSRLEQGPPAPDRVGIDTSSVPDASISGTVTHGSLGVPIEGVRVTAWLDRGSWWEDVAGFATSPDGTYLMQGLAAGTYRVDFSHPDFGHEWYDDALYPEQATNLLLAAGQSATGVDAELINGGKISGVVLEASTGAPSTFNIPVVAYRLEDRGWQEFGATSASDTTGRYTLESLPAGTYRVKFDGGAIYDTEYYDDVSILANADDIIVNAGNTVMDINARLDRQVVLDEEIVLLAEDGRIIVRDPYTPAGVLPVIWESPTVGWQQLAVGDFNGDGADEIVALKDSVAQIFDPIVPGCTPGVAHEFTAPGPWRQVLTGDLDGDGRDELFMTHDVLDPSAAARAVAFDSDPSGTQWNQVWQQDFGAPFQQFATGDLNGDGDDELAGIRNVPAVSFYQVVIWDPSASWAILYEGNYSYEWTALAIGNTHADPSGSDELVLSRNPGTPLVDSYKVFRCCRGTSLIELESTSLFPPYIGIIAGDVNGSGDEEVYLLRSGMAGNQPVVALTSRNYGSDFSIQFNELSGQTRFRQVATGDLDGDARAEVVVSSADEYLQYMEPESSRSYTSFPGVYDQNGSLVIGDIDGSNESACGPIYLPIVLKP